MNGYEADLGVLDSIVRALRNASADVDGLGHSVPNTPDAGDGTPAVVGILAHLVENASTLVLGAAGAADDVASAAITYRESDNAARSEIYRAFGSGRDGN